MTAALIIVGLVAVTCFAWAVIATRAAVVTGGVARYQAQTIATLRAKLDLAEAENAELKWRQTVTFWRGPRATWESP